MIDKLTFSPLRDTDVPALQESCWPTSSLSTIEERIIEFVKAQTRKRTWPRVVRCIDEVIGFGQLLHWGQGYEIADLMITPTWRGKGVGTALIKEFLRIAYAQDADIVEIGVAHNNPRALALYQRLGFEPYREIQLNLGNGYEPVTYLKMNLSLQQEILFGDQEQN